MTDLKIAESKIVENARNMVASGGGVVKTMVARRGVYDPKDLLEVLGQTVKQDNSNKIIVFLSQLLAYTENDQLNISFNAPSSSGKSYLALEIASLFPDEDIIALGFASPASFFHTKAVIDKASGAYVVDLERKILIFLDMPHPQLLERLRPVLSHDKKIVHVKIADKQKFGMTTKDIHIKGHSSVIFCTASFNLDEQELTRFLLLSPETTQEKIRAAVHELIAKESNSLEYYRKINNNSKRQDLKERIKAIRDCHINQINLHDTAKLIQLFTERNKTLKPRHTRDIKRIVCLIKGFALLNLWDRNYNETEGIIETNDQDYINAMEIWDQISIAQDLGLAPHLLNLFNEIIVAKYNEKGQRGITRKEILKKHFEVYGRHLQERTFRREYLPMLENSGLIVQEQDPVNTRQLLIYPLGVATILEKTDTRYEVEDDGEIVADPLTVAGFPNIR